jgi:hypothetical protein
MHDHPRQESAVSPLAIRALHCAEQAGIDPCRVALALAIPLHDVPRLMAGAEVTPSVNARPAA